MNMRALVHQGVWRLHSDDAMSVDMWAVVQKNSGMENLIYYQRQIIAGEERAGEVAQACPALPVTV